MDILAPEHAALGVDSSPEALLRKFGLTVEDVSRLASNRPGSQVMDNPIEPGPGRSISHAEIARTSIFSQILYTLDAFGLATDLDELLTSHIHGYSVELRKSGRTVFALNRGNARDPVDTRLSWSTDVRMNVASVSKVITAAALVRLLGESGVSLDSHIEPWLPAYWVRGPNVQKVTFRELMQHDSGFRRPGTVDFVGAREQIADGAIRPLLDPLPPAYANVNYILCRVLFATLLGADPHAWDADRLANYPSLKADDFCDLVSRMAYANYVNEAIFSPAGLAWRSFDRDDSMALQYDFPASGPGTHLKDGFAWCGSSGWLLSVDELLRVAAAILRNPAIMSTPQLEDMLESLCGVTDGFTSPLGTYYAKNGGDCDPGTGTKWEQSLLFLIPGRRELAFLANSQTNPNQWLLGEFQERIDANIVTWFEFLARVAWRRIKAMLGI
jgi:CubicO group peptidase (beta-lactamase class C family)